MSTVYRVFVCTYVLQFQPNLYIDFQNTWNNRYRTNKYYSLTLITQACLTQMIGVFKIEIGIRFLRWLMTTAQDAVNYNEKRYEV